MEKEEDTSNYLCGICLELLYGPVTLLCGHTVCKGCLETYIRTCRAKVIEEEEDELPFKEMVCPVGCGVRQTTALPNISVKLLNTIREQCPKAYAIRHEFFESEKKKKEQEEITEKERREVLLQVAKETIDKLVELKKDIETSLKIKGEKKESKRDSSEEEKEEDYNSEEEEEDNYSPYFSEEEEEETIKSQGKKIIDKIEKRLHNFHEYIKDIHKLQDPILNYSQVFLSETEQKELPDHIQKMIKELQYYGTQKEYYQAYQLYGEGIPKEEIDQEKLTSLPASPLYFLLQEEEEEEKKEEELDLSSTFYILHLIGRFLPFWQKTDTSSKTELVELFTSYRELLWKFNSSSNSWEKLNLKEYFTLEQHSEWRIKLLGLLSTTLQLNKLKEKEKEKDVINLKLPGEPFDVYLTTKNKWYNPTTSFKYLYWNQKELSFKGRLQLSYLAMNEFCKKWNPNFSVLLLLFCWIATGLICFFQNSILLFPPASQSFSLWLNSYMLNSIYFLFCFHYPRFFHLLLLFSFSFSSSFFLFHPFSLIYCLAIYFLPSTLLFLEVLLYFNWSLDIPQDFLLGYLLIFKSMLEIQNLRQGYMNNYIVKVNFKKLFNKKYLLERIQTYVENVKIDLSYENLISSMNIIWFLLLIPWQLNYLIVVHIVGNCSSWILCYFIFSMSTVIREKWKRRKNINNTVACHPTFYYLETKLQTRLIEDEEDN